MENEHWAHFLALDPHQRQQQPSPSPSSLSPLRDWAGPSLCPGPRRARLLSPPISLAGRWTLAIRVVIYLRPVYMAMQPEPVGPTQVPFFWPGLAQL